jgi:RimJ/RimL family protein N-acetyltransferase
MTDGRPVGPEVDAIPAKRPEAVILEGRFGRVEKLDPARHGEPLWEAVSGRDALWTYMSYGPFADTAAFTAWLAQRAMLDDPFSYTVIDARGRACGIATLMEIRPAMRVIEVGHIVYGSALQRTPLGTEAQYLLARYAFEELRYRRYEWKCDALNAPSRRAALRYGFSFEGIFRSHMIVKGRSRDTAWYAMLDAEWPARKRAFELWLAADNFDAAGRQRERLSAMMQSARSDDHESQACGTKSGEETPWPIV